MKDDRELIMLITKYAKILEQKKKLEQLLIPKLEEKTTSNGVDKKES